MEKWVNVPTQWASRYQRMPGEQGKISIKSSTAFLAEAKTSIKALKKQKCYKFQRLTHFFNIQSYMLNKTVMKKWVNIPTQWASDVLWASNGRLYDARPSIENMARPENVQIVSIMGIHQIPILDVQLASICGQFNEAMFRNSYLGRYLQLFTSTFCAQNFLNISP